MTPSYRYLNEIFTLSRILHECFRVEYINPEYKVKCRFPIGHTFCETFQISHWSVCVPQSLLLLYLHWMLEISMNYRKHIEINLGNSTTEFLTWNIYIYIITRSSIPPPASTRENSLNKYYIHCENMIDGRTVQML